VANIKVETTVTTVNDVDTDDFPLDYTMDDILETCRNQAKILIDDSIDNDTANITNRVLEVVHPSDGS